jgi:DNA polymerase alpha subunit A
LVRRDWCPISKEAGRYVVEQILSGKPREEIVFAIHEYLQDLATKIRSSQIDMAAFVVTKSLNKNPKDYPDCKGQAHLQVALQMVKANKPVNIGDHIPYVICVQVTDCSLALFNVLMYLFFYDSCLQGPEGAQATARAYHPDEVVRKNGELTLDYEWYISTQLLPPISRLCEPIEGTSPAIISEKLGLDASKSEFSLWNGF